MGGGLGSGAVEVKPEEKKVSPSQDIEENKGNDLKQNVFDLNDDPVVSSLKESGIEKKEEIQECREDVEVKVSDLNENERKIGIVEDNKDTKEDDGVKKNVKEEGLQGKVQFSRRVLRSSFALKNGSQNGGDECESGGDKTGDSNSCENKTVQAVEESDYSHVEAKEVQRKSGRRPRMKCSDGYEKIVANAERGQSNCSDGDKVGKMAKRKPGRPPKLQGNNGCEEKRVKLQEGENDYSDGELRKEFKRKRGRPPKVPGNSGFEKKAVKIEAGESDHFDGDMSKESKRKRGRPPKMQGNSGFKNTAVKVEARESDQSDSVGSKKSKKKRGRPTKVQRNEGFEKKADEVKARESCHSDVEIRKEANHKHGMPPRMHGNDGFEINAVNLEKGEGDCLDCELRKEAKHKCGRRPKVQGSDQNNGNIRGVIRKRGRPPKLQDGNEAFKRKLVNKRRKLGGLIRGRKKLRGNMKFNVPTSTSYSEKGLVGKESNVKRFAYANKVRSDGMEKNDSKASVMLRPAVVNVEDKDKNLNKAGDEVEQKRSKAKQAVRDRIVKLLKAAGWTIDYRPRNNREYNDAVYVNPEGRTHWSVTLAYRVLKKYYESGDCDSKVSPNGFIFTPIPEEEISILTRIVQKKRKGKKKPNREDDDTVDDGESEKKINKRKKKWKGNRNNEDIKKKKKQKLLKEKHLLHEEENFDGMLQRGTQLSDRKRKLQNTQNRKRYALLARNSMDGAESDNNGYVLYDGKRTVLAWMIDLGIVPQYGKVEYLIQRRTRTTRECKSGRITQDGIQCNCCSDVFTVAEFETHAGSKLHRPFQNICLETRISLLQCLLDAWNKQQQPNHKGFHFVDFGGEDPNDDTCGICGDGGDLICCDSCPSTFHQSCLEIKAFPSGNWNCVYCTCKYCGMVENIYQKDRDEEKDLSILSCQLCEEKYHQPCIQPLDAFDDCSCSASFCGNRCKELFERLQMLIGVKHELPEGFSWSLLHRFDISSDVCLNEAYQMVESNSKLAVALSVMDECFLPLVDHRSGINLIYNIVYNFGSNFTRLNYSGFFTAILERGDEIISAASIRIHGNQLAEMPFIGTRYTYRRQGMCRRLLCAIESALSSLNVEKLVIPAISELRETWTSVFGFQPLETASKQKMRNMNMLVFPGVDMLQKPLLMHAMKNKMMAEGSKKSGEKCSVVFDLNVSAESPAPQTDERNDEATAFESRLPDGTLKYTSGVMGDTIDPPECATLSCSCIPASEQRKLDFDSQLRVSCEEKIEESIVKQNHDSKHEGSVKHSADIINAENKVAVLVRVSNVAGKSVVTNGFDGTIRMSKDANDMKDHENSKSQPVECFPDFDKTVLMTEVKNCDAVAKDGGNHTSPSALPSLAPVNVNLHTCEVFDDDASREENSQFCIRMSTELVSAGSKVAVTNIHDQRETSIATV
ncbi:hypothetical protein DITRI_Ditri11bG0091600 [Diplodiscus trichospermus]